METRQQANSSRWHSREPLFCYLRQQMVEEQLRAHGIVDERVLDAMAQVPRELFVPCHEQDLAYEDLPLGLGGGQTLPRPCTLALMCQLLDLQPDERVLEVGTGTGYSAAILSHLAQRVISLAQVPAWTRPARERLERLGCQNVDLCRVGEMVPPPGLFDAVLVSMPQETVPDAYLQQLAEGGRLVIPLGDWATGEALYRFCWRRGRLTSEKFAACSSAPWITARSGNAMQWP